VLSVAFIATEGAEGHRIFFENLGGGVRKCGKPASKITSK